MTPMEFSEQLPFLPRTEFTALVKLEVAINELSLCCEALQVHARTQAEREEWWELVKSTRGARIDKILAIEAAMYGKDVWKVFAEGKRVNVPSLFRLVGEADALGRLHIRTVGTNQLTNIEDRVAAVHHCLLRLIEAHEENSPLPEPTVSAFTAVLPRG